MSLHTYSVNDLLNATERTHVLYKLAAVSSLVVGSISAFLAWLTQQWGISIGLTAPATIVVYLFAVRRVELDLWAQPTARRLLGISLPNVNGRWNGTVETRTRDGKTIDGNTGEMCIVQTWSTIGVEFETKRTRSHSTGAFLTQGASCLLLTIEYQVDVRAPHKDEEGVHAHKGTAEFRIPVKNKGCDLSEIEVSYYTDHRETGVIRLVKQP